MSFLTDDNSTELTSLVSPNEDRSSGLRDELLFWDEWLSTKSSAWPGDYSNRLDPESLLSDEHRTFIDPLAQEQIRILDVGAGPLTILGKKHPSKQLLIYAVDVLSDNYDELLVKYHVKPPVRTTFAEAENLTTKFAKESFDLVTARNSLDHAVDPTEAIRQMLLVTKKGCFALLDHSENEGQAQKYQGLHKWNFTIVDEELVLWGAGLKINISRRLSCLGDFQCHLKDRWVKVSIRKK